MTTKPRLIAGLSLAALVAMAACGRDTPQDADAAVADTEQTQLAEARPDIYPEDERDPRDADGLPPIPQAAPGGETLDLGTEHVEIFVTLPPEVVNDPVLNEQLRAAAIAEADEAKAVAAEDAAMRADQDFPFHQHFLHINFEPRFANDGVLSLLRTTSVYQGGAHPNYYFEVVNWDRAAQDIIAVNHLFTDEAWAALSPLAEDALMAKKRERLGDGLSDEDYWRSDIIMATAPAAENFSMFTLAPSASDPALAGGISIHYPPYAVGPYVEGDYHIFIPHTAFAQYIVPQYAGLFGGEPAAPQDLN